MLVPMANVAAFPDATQLSASALPLRHAVLGRGVFLARLENRSETETVVLLQGKQGSLRSAAAQGGQQGGVLGYVWDMAQLIIPG